MSRIIMERLEKIRAQGLYRALRPVAGTGPHSKVDGKAALLFCSNNYLGLADHPALKKAAADAAMSEGTSSAASRLVSGNLPLFEMLETEVADWKKTETALLFNSGYAANTGIIDALAGRGDQIFSDRLNHASIIDGALLSGAKLIRYPHCNASALAELMEKHPCDGLRLIVTDGVFSMDGDMAPLEALAEVAGKFGALLMVDDAHGSGVLGEQGRGTADHQMISAKVDIHMGTFGKALGGYGAYAATSHLIKDYLINRARSLIFSTALPPAVLAASLEAVKLVRGEEGGQLRGRLKSNISRFRSGLKLSGFQIPDDMTPIVPIMVGDPQKTMQFTGMLLDDGLFLQGIRPPTVPVGTSRLRCTIMATHTEEHIDFAVNSISAAGRKLGLI